MSDKCAARVFRDFRYYTCENNATREGFCGVHHPDAVAARNAKKRAKWDAEHNATVNKSNETARILSVHADLVAALESILEMTQEDECTRSNSSRVYEIGTYARLAIAKAKGQSA